MALAVATVVAVATTLALTGRSAGQPGLPAGLHPVLSDSFAGQGLDPRAWTTCFTDPPASVAEGCPDALAGAADWLLPSQVTTGSGAALVAAARATPGRDGEGAPTTFAYRSGALTSRDRFSFAYGYVQVTATVPVAQGIEAVIGLYPVGGSLPGMVLADVRSDGARPGITVSVGGDRRTVPLPLHPFSAQHFAALWRPGEVQLLVDGRVVLTSRSAVPAERMYIGVDLAVTAPQAAVPSTLLLSEIEVMR